MLNNKLKAIAKEIKHDDIVIDIGCDHAYLAIYLKKNNLCEDVYASDISANVVKIAEDNIKKNRLKIEVYLSDGFKSITNTKINTAITSGMGTSTILKIVNTSPQNITKYIISSNNDYELLRKSMVKKEFYIQKEVVIKENNKYYPIMVFTKENQQENKLTIKFGKSNNSEYYNYLLKKEEEIIKRIPHNHFLTILKHQKNIHDLRKLI